MKLNLSVFKILNTFILILLTVCTSFTAYADYETVDGRVSYLAGITAQTNFQESFSGNGDSGSKLGRSQSFAVLFQALGDLSSKSSLMAESTIGIHKFCKEAAGYVDDFKLEAISFDLGYRRWIGGNFWFSAGLGSLYPWKVTQKVNSQPGRYNESEFSSLYSILLGFQYESELFHKPVSYDFRVRKYMSGQVDDQMSLGFSVGFRFGM